MKKASKWIKNKYTFINIVYQECRVHKYFHLSAFSSRPSKQEFKVWPKSKIENLRYETSGSIETRSAELSQGERRTLHSPSVWWGRAEHAWRMTHAAVQCQQRMQQQQPPAWPAGNRSIVYSGLLTLKVTLEECTSLPDSKWETRRIWCVARVENVTSGCCENWNQLWQRASKLWSEKENLRNRTPTSKHYCSEMSRATSMRSPSSAWSTPVEEPSSQRPKKASTSSSTLMALLALAPLHLWRHNKEQRALSPFKIRRLWVVSKFCICYKFLYFPFSEKLQSLLSNYLDEILTNTNEWMENPYHILWSDFA